MFERTTNAFNGFPMPPRGWPLVVLLALFILAGLFGHDPWKNDDAITIGVTADMLQRGHWLLPHLADRPYPDAPLYYWTAALTGTLFSWAMPLHDAIRLASGLWVALTLFLLYRAGREWHIAEPAPHEFAIASTLAMAGCLGFLVHAHEAQPMLVALAGHAAAYWAFALLPRKPVRAAVIFGLALGLGFVGNGFAPMLALLPVALAALWLQKDRIKAGKALAGGTVLGLAIAAPWPLMLAALEPGYFWQWLGAEVAQIGRPASALRAMWEYLVMLPWFAWPALPLALWTLRSKRRFLREPSYQLPMLATVAVLLSLSVTFEARSSSALLLLPPLALLAAPGVATLRRGAANAFDWFGVMTFSFFCALVWVGWSAMVMGVPEQLAKRAVKLAPGFVGQFHLLPFVIALAITLAWGWMLTTGQRQRSPWRGLVHWLGGLTTLWLLLMSLWLPWIEYGKSYQSVGTALKAALPAQYGCVIGRNISEGNRAVIDYYAGVAVRRDNAKGSERCNWLLVLRDARASRNMELPGWRVITEIRRPSERSERFVLYRRDGKQPVPEKTVPAEDAGTQDPAETP
jgi:4-amino-4-deoxy-L-arabinose transferase-like glycosyltransferase